MNGGDRTTTATKSSSPVRNSQESKYFASSRFVSEAALRGPGDHDDVKYATRIDPQSTPHKSTRPRAARVSASGTPTPNENPPHTRHTPPCCLQTHERADTRQRHRASHSILRGPRRLRAASWSHPTPQAQHRARTTCEYDDIRWHARAAPWRSLCMRTCNTLTPRHTAHTAGRQRSIGGVNARHDALS